MCTNRLQYKFLWVDPCLFKLVCLIEESLKLVQEKTKIFIFLLYLFFQFALINDQWNAFFPSIRINYVCGHFVRIKGLKDMPLIILVIRSLVLLTRYFTLEKENKFEVCACSFYVLYCFELNRVGSAF